MAAFLSLCWFEGTEKDYPARQKTDLEQFFQTKGSEPFTITFIPPGPNDSVEYLSSFGILYRFNLPYAGRYDIRGKTFSGGFVVGKKDDGYLLSFYVEADDPPPEKDDLLQQREPTEVEREKIKSYFAGTLSEQDLLGNAPWLLRAKNPTQSARAARWMYILLKQGLEAEVRGDVPWLPTPYMNGPSHVNQARELRSEIAEALRDSLPPCAYKLSNYFLREEVVPGLQEQGAHILARVKGDSANRALIDLVERPHPNSRITKIALEAVEQRGLRVSSRALRELALGYRPSLAEAARPLNEKLGYPSLPSFDPVKAYRSNAVQQFLVSLDSLLIQPPLVKDRFVKVENRYVSDTDTSTWSYSGWLERETRDTLYLLTPSGWRKQFAKRDTSKTDEGKVRAVSSAKLVQWNWKDEAKALGDKLGHDDEMARMLDHNDPALHRITFARWLALRGEEGGAARITIPLLDTFSNDAEALDYFRDVLGIQRGYRMFVAFVGDRDYARTLDEARMITSRYQDTMFSKYAEQMLKELPQRMDDFKTFCLPTNGEWRELQKRLSRSEQIDYLCDHLRLINGFQWGQPGGLSVGMDQTLEPQGMAEDASWGLDRGKTIVINPFRELSGDSTAWRAPAGERIHLEISDLPRLAAHLRNDWFILGVEFWRDFRPQRHLYRTSQLLAGLICGIAEEKIVEADYWPLLSPSERESRIQRVVDWTKENASRSKEDRFVRQFREAKTWYDVERLLPTLYEHKRTDLVPEFLSFLKHENTNEFNRESIFRACRTLDPKQAEATAKEYLDDPYPGARIQAALIQVEAGNKELGLDVIAKTLSEGTNSNLSQQSALDGVKILLSQGILERKRQAEVILQRSYFLDGWGNDQSVLIKELIAARSRAAYSWLIGSLQDTTERGSNGRGQLLRRQDYTAGLAVYLVPRDLGLGYDFNDPEDKRENTRSRMIAWFTEQMAALPNEGK